jgi:hypothetical protein
VHRANPDRTGVVAGLEDGEGGVAIAPQDRAGPRADVGKAAGRHACPPVHIMAVRVPTPRVAAFQQRTQCGSMKADPVAPGPEATPEMA